MWISLIWNMSQNWLSRAFGCVWMHCAHNVRVQVQLCTLKFSSASTIKDFAFYCLQFIILFLVGASVTKPICESVRCSYFVLFWVLSLLSSSSDTVQKKHQIDRNLTAKHTFTLKPPLMQTKNINCWFPIAHEKNQKVNKI